MAPVEEEDIDTPTEHPISLNQEADPSTPYAIKYHPAKTDYVSLQTGRKKRFVSSSNVDLSLTEAQERKRDIQNQPVVIMEVMILNTNHGYLSMTNFCGRLELITAVLSRYQRCIESAL
jgi:hypothetical protein